MAFKRFTHSPLTVEHQGIKASISEDGRITLTKEHEEEYDEITIPASLVFKLSSLLRATRKISFTSEPFNGSINE